MNWLAPILVCIATGLVFVFAVFSQEAILQQIREQQSKAIQQQVAAGKIGKAQAEQAEQMMEKVGPMMMKVAGAVGTVIGSFFSPFAWGLVLLVLAKMIKKDLPYMKLVEMTGLASMVLAFGILLSLFLALIFGRLASGPSLAWLVSEVDFTNKKHMALAAVNIINLWYVALVALALKTFTSVSYVKAAGLVFSVWLAVRVFFILVGQGQFVM